MDSPLKIRRTWPFLCADHSSSSYRSVTAAASALVTRTSIIAAGVYSFSPVVIHSLAIENILLTFTMTSQPENEPVPSASESIQPTDPNTVAEPVNSSSTSTSPSAATAAAAVAPAAIPSSHAHPAFPSLPQPGKLPSTPQEIHQILSLPADQFTAKGLPLLAKVADGKPFEGASLKAWERRNAGEQLLTLYEAGDQVYETTDERVKDIGGGLVYVLYVMVYLWCFESYIGC